MPPVNSSGLSAKEETNGNININTPYVPRQPAPLVSISVNHPIATVVRKIKNFLTHKQTLFSTTFTIKITPIVAIVSLFGALLLFGGGVTTAFNFGKTVQEKFMLSVLTPTTQPSPTSVPTKTPLPIIVSKTGIVKATYQLPPQPLPTVILTPGTDSTTPLPTLTPVPVLHYILQSRSGSIVFLSGEKVDFNKYLNYSVLVTGSFDNTRNTITVKKEEDIEVLQ